jgi:TonB family protein
LMNSLINSSPSDEMFWFAGKAAFVLAKAPVPTPIGEHGRFVQSTVGVFNITDKIVGKIRITSESANASTNLTNYYKKIASVTQLFEDPNAGLKLLSEGFTLEQDGSLITMSLNFPADVLPKIWQWSTHPVSDDISKNKASEPSKPIVKSKDTIDPVILFQPTPSYTEEARKNRIQGRIVLDLIVRKDGAPSNIMIRKKLGYGLDESAINTIASRWRFIPGIVDGKPVDLMATIEVAFNIF